ncbi:TrbL/VirB6 family protein [Anaplasma bovis]|uniref:type IV secretion system protein n=1 Tax=Anaplasma bovis TaxID=186733 RepID=UPI002FF25667
MLKLAKAVSFFFIFTVCGWLVPSIGCFAEEAAVKEDRLVHYRYSEATNPRCGASKNVAIVGGKAVGGGLAAMLAGAVLINMGQNFLGWGLVATGTAAVSAAVGASSSYFICNWSFVRHPVLRFEGKGQGPKTEESGYSEGDYKECQDPQSGNSEILALYKNSSNGSCSKEFATMEEYYACLGAGKKTLEEAKRTEPICPKGKFKKVDYYAWPKNRVSSSRYIEVCYRNPLSYLAAAPFLLFGLQFASGSYTEILKNSSKYPREATFGDEEMHKTKLTVSGAWVDSSESVVKCERMKAGDKRNIHTAQFRAVERGSQLCVDAIAVGSGNLGLAVKPEIGCQMRPSTAPSPMCKDSKPVEEGGKVIKYDNSSCYSCYVADVCKGTASLHSQTVFPVTSVLVSCVKESLKQLLDPPAGCAARRANAAGLNPGFLKVAQERLKKAVMAALVLALILFSIKAVMGGVQGGSELYMTAIKFALVIYFTQGNAMTHAYDYITKLSIGLSDIVLQAAGNNGICDYKAEDYKNKEFLYLMPWDRLDCRMMFYLGSQLNWGTGTGVVLTMLLCAGLLIVAMLINAKVIICLVTLCAVIMLILLVICTVYVFLISLIALTILVIISPLMIPMCLFQATKGFFDGWTKQLMTFALYPVILFSFLSLMFTVFDNLYFGNLQFERKDVVIGQKEDGTEIKKTGYKLKDEKACEKSENDSNLACMFSTVQFHSKKLFLGLYGTSPEFRSATVAVWTKLGVFVLVGFLFYHFLSSISYIAGELAGDPRVGAIGSGSFNPRTLAHKAASMASSARSFSTGKVSDLADKLRGKVGDNMGKGGGEGSDKVSGGSGGSSQGGEGK